MSKFLKWMRDELEGIKQADIKAPTRKVEVGDEVIGRLEDPEIQKLCVLNFRLSDQVRAQMQALTHLLVDQSARENSPNHN